MKRARTVSSLAVIAACTMVVATGCGSSGGSHHKSSNDGGSSANAGGGGGTFSYAITEPDKIVPGETTSSYSNDVINAVFDTLTRLDDKGKVHMEDASSITSKDQKTWTIKLRAGNKFQNGEPVTAQSYADAWNHAAYGPNGAAANYYFANIKGYDALNPDKGKPKVKTLSGLKVLNPTTLQVTLNAPFSDFPLTLATPFAFAPLPKAAFTDPKSFAVHPIGDGPFEMDGNWQHNEQIRVKKYAGYTGPRKPHVAGIDYKIYTSNDTAYTDLTANNVDYIDTIPAAKVEDAKRTLGDRLLTTPSGTMDYLGFPLFEKQFQDVRVREAISMAIDRQGIVNAVYNGTFKPMGSLIPPIVPGYQANACGQVCTYDPKKAKQLLTEAGGWKGGTLTLWLSNADPTYQTWMTDVANNLKQNLGIKSVKLRVVPASDYLDELNNNKENGIFRNNWVMDYPSAQDYLQTMWGPDNRMGWKGADFQKFSHLIDQANAAAGSSAKDGLFQQAQAVALKDLPMTPLWNWQDEEGYSNKISNVHVDPYVGLHIEDVTVK